ncbi:hypothetical protein PV327_007429 [Microctonus hyperodae]|uniref:Uncharacterized protein n=1 Tax=Microctonus hyperodae TaxID=165561 RepID=A0AA39FZX4_MICHY|nr:hypothetical protein PV327_007429 [Microctonus hyperodae]
MKVQLQPKDTDHRFQLSIISTIISPKINQRPTIGSRQHVNSPINKIICVHEVNKNGSNEVMSSRPNKSTNSSSIGTNQIYENDVLRKITDKDDVAANQNA